MSYYPPIVQFGTERPIVNVLDYGADPTGTTDSTAAIQNAFAAIPVTGGVAYFPTGIYLSIGGLVRTNPQSFTIRGDGKGSIIRAHSFTQTLLTLGQSGSAFEEATIENIVIDGAASTQIFIGIRAFSMRHSVFRSVELIANASSSCIVLDATGTLGCFSNDFINVETRACKFGIKFNGLGAAQANAHNIIGGSITGDGSIPAGGIGIYHTQGASLNVYGTGISNFETILKLDAGSVKGSFFGMAMEGFTTGVVIIAGANDHSFYGGGRTDASVTVVSNSGLRNKFYHFNGYDLGPPTINGIDNRSGVTTADGSPIVLYAVPAGANQLFDAGIEIDATSFTSGTATYTMTYTENGVSQTIVVTATVLNVVTGVRRLIQPDASTNITVQLTGAFVATVRLSAVVLQLA